MRSQRTAPCFHRDETISSSFRKKKRTTSAHLCLTERILIVVGPSSVLEDWLRIKQSFDFLLYRGNYSRRRRIPTNGLVSKALSFFPSIQCDSYDNHLSYALNFNFFESIEGASCVVSII